MKIFYEDWHDRIHVAKRTSFAFANHMHDMVEIVYLTQGTANVSCNGTDYRLQTGELFIAFPNLMHSYWHTEAVTGYITIFKSDILKSFGESFSSKIPICPVIGADELSPKIPPLFEEAAETFKKNPPFKGERLFALIVLLLSHVLEKLTFCQNKNLNMDTASQVFTYCNENFCESISLDSVSRALSTSKYHIIRIFREKLNTTFQAYINKLRIEKAKQLLKETSDSVTEISIKTGYNTICSFNRAFLADTGLSPSQYRKRTK